MEKKNHTFLYAMKLWLIWNVLADLSLVIFIVGNMAIYMVAQFAGYVPDVLLFSIYLLIPMLLSLIVGLIQWIAFKSRIKHAYWWILATALGWSVAGILLFYLYGIYLSETYASSIGMAFLTEAIVGAVIGLSQWLVLRGQVREDGLWLEGSILGWACAGCAAFVLSQTSMGIVGALVGLSIMGMITGVAHAYLFSQPSQTRFSEEVAFRRADFKPAIPDPPPF